MDGAVSGAARKAVASPMGSDVARMCRWMASVMLWQVAVQKLKTEIAEALAVSSHFKTLYKVTLEEEERAKEKARRELEKMTTQYRD